jgi:pimeloyl-ACP methyl ester carboxylesterase
MTMTAKFLISILLAGQISCNESDANFKSDSTYGYSIENEGVIIDYDDSKKGDTTLLFIHGWNIDKSYWANQTRFFSKKYRVVAPDLPGFGKSGKNRKTWTVEDYGRDITAVITKLNLKNVIVIGHSMSGVIALEAALSNPTRVIGLVGIDNFTNFGYVQSAQEKEDVANAYGALRTNYKQTALEYANQYLFSPSTDSAVRNKVKKDFLNADSVIAVNCLQQNDKYPSDDKLRSLKKVLYLINSDYRRTDTTAFKKSKVDFCLLNIGPTGHYPMIEKPKEFNLLLKQVIGKIGGSVQL